MPLKQELLEDVRRLGVFKSGHYKLSSGAHTNNYIDKVLIYQDPQLPRKIGYEAASAIWRICISASDTKPAEWPDIIVSPVGGAVLFGHSIIEGLAELVSAKSRSVAGTSDRRELIRRLSLVQFAWTEKIKDGGMAIRRDCLRLFGNFPKVLIADNVLTGGGTIGRTAEAVRKAGGIVIGTIIMFNRGTLTASDLNVPFLETVFETQFPSWPKKECDLCKHNVPLSTLLGHG